MHGNAPRHDRELGRGVVRDDAGFDVTEARSARHHGQLDRRDPAGRNSSVMAFCKMVLRRTVEMTSIAPATPRQASPIQTMCTRPKMVIAAPQAMTTGRGDEATLTANARNPPGDDRHEECSGARRGVEETEGPRTSVIERQRDGGEERTRQPKDHGVEVNEIHGLHDCVASNVAKTVADRSKHSSPGVLARGRHRRHERRQHGQHREGDGIDGVTREESDARDQDPGEGGPDDGG